MQSSICSTIIEIAPMLRAFVQESHQVHQGKNPNWRINWLNFLQAERQICKPGSVVFSVGWFALGHTVRFQVFLSELIVNNIFYSLKMMS